MCSCCKCYLRECYQLMSLLETRPSPHLPFSIHLLLKWPLSLKRDKPLVISWQPLKIIMISFVCILLLMASLSHLRVGNLFLIFKSRTCDSTRGFICLSIRWSYRLSVCWSISLSLFHSYIGCIRIPPITDKISQGLFLLVTNHRKNRPGSDRRTETPSWIVYRYPVWNTETDRRDRQTDHREGWSTKGIMKEKKERGRGETRERERETETETETEAMDF